MPRVIHILSPILLLASAASAGPADEWLARAEKELVLLATSDDRTAIALPNYDHFARHMAALRGNEVDKARLVEIAEKLEKKPDIDVYSFAEGLFAWQAADAWLLAGRPDDARRVAHMVAAVTNRKGKKRDAKLMAYRARFGDLTPEEIGALSTDSALEICKLFAAHDEAQRQAPFLLAGLAAAPPGDSTQRKLQESAIELLVVCNRIDDAIARADAASPKIRGELLSLVVRLAIETGNKVSADRAATAFLKAAAAAPDDPGLAPTYAVHRVLTPVISDRFLVQAIEMAEPHSRPGFPDSAFHVGAMVEACDRLGRTEQRDRWYKKIDDCIASEKDTERAETSMRFAGLAARLNRPDDADRWIAATRNAKVTAGLELGIERTVTDLARSGQVERAERLLKTLHPNLKDNSVRCASLAAAYARGGHYAAAEEAATRLLGNRDTRLCIKCVILLHRIEHSRPQEVMAWIDAEPSVRDRVALNLIAAEEAMGRRLHAYSWTLRKLC